MDINATIFGQLISFFLFFLFCMKKIWPPITKIIEDRRKEIMENLSFIENSKEELSFLKEEAMNQIKNSQIEARSIIERAKIEKEKIISDARIEAEKQRKEILLKTEIEISEQYEKSRQELINQISNLAIFSAEEILKKSLEDFDGNKIIDRMISKI